MATVSEIAASTPKMYTTASMRTVVEQLNNVGKNMRPIRNFKELAVGKWYEITNCEGHLQNEVSNITQKTSIVRKPVLTLVDRSEDSNGDIIEEEFKLYLIQTYGMDISFNNLKKLAGSDGNKFPGWIQMNGFTPGDGTKSEMPIFIFFEGPMPPDLPSTTADESSGDDRSRSNSSSGIQTGSKRCNVRVGSPGTGGGGGKKKKSGGGGDTSPPIHIR